MSLFRPARANDSYSNFPIFEAFNNNLKRVEKCVIKSTFFHRMCGCDGNSMLLDFMCVTSNFHVEISNSENMIHVYNQHNA